MEISYLGHSSFKLTNKSTVVVTDPYDPKMMGLKFPKLDHVDIVTISHEHPDHNCLEVLPKPGFVVRGPGEYEVNNVFVRGVATFHDDKKGEERGRNVVFAITIDGVIVCHLGDLGHKLTEEQQDAIHGVDILLVPVGGFYTINSNIASEVVAQLEPRIVIPMHFNREGLDQKNFGSLDRVDKFLKEMGAEGVEPQNKLSVTKEKLPETTTVVVLN